MQVPEGVKDMYEFLYALTTFGIVGWLLMIFFRFCR
jgi:hypothetical protein